jgi:glycine C-acetyltransferase
MEITGVNKLFTALRDQYYNLRRKDYFEKLTFGQRFDEGNNLRENLMQQGYYQYRREMDGFYSVPAQNSTNGTHKVNLASNDYLGFARHPRIIEAGIEYLKKGGTGSGSVPMLAGTFAIHKELEKCLADFTGYHSSLAFNSGYAANYGLLTTILTSRDVAILDTHVHASILDGCCNSNIIFFRHNDCHSLQSALMKAANYQNKLVIVDGIYSMEGDAAPLKAIIELARNNNALVMVDESHAIGVMGKQGRGTQEWLGLIERADLTSGSLGKALGAIGGYVAGPPGLVSLMELACRSFIFSASLPPSVAASLVKAIELLEKNDECLARLRNNILFFKEGLQQIGMSTGDSVSAIIPLRVRDDEKLMRLTQLLFEKGVVVNPVFYPVVPKRQSLIRLSISAALTTDQLEYALGQLEVHGKILEII